MSCSVCTAAYKITKANTKCYQTILFVNFVLKEVVELVNRWRLLVMHTRALVEYLFEIPIMLRSLLTWRWRYALKSQISRLASFSPAFLWHLPCSNISHFCLRLSCGRWL